MLFEICRWTKPQNYYLLKEQIFGNNQVKCTPHDRSSLYDSAAFVFCTDIFPFFIGQKCEQLKPVGISLWKYCLKRNYFTVKIKTDVENSWFYGNKQTKQCKSQITLSVCLMITKGQNVFFFCELGWGPRISLSFSRWNPNIFLQNKIIIHWTICESENIWLSQ